MGNVFRTSSTNNRGGNAYRVPEGPKKIVEALYVFERTDSNELSFKIGDQLEIENSVNLHSDGWLHATNISSKEQGFIPSNFVKEVDCSDSLRKAVKFRRKSTDPLPNPSSQSVPSPAVQVTIKKALHDYVGKSPEEITFKTGDKFEIQLSSDDNNKKAVWLVGKHMKTKQTGFIPGNFLGDDDDDPHNDKLSNPVTTKRNLNKPLPTPTTLPTPTSAEQVTVETKKKILRALYDYDSRVTDEISFKQGDKFEIQLLPDDDNTGEHVWLQGTHMKTKKIGFIPSNYFCDDADDFHDHKWWFDCKRDEAIATLKCPANAKGAYMIRPSKADNSACALTIRDEKDGKPVIKHFLIKAMDNGGYYILASRTFSSLVDLIKSYKKNSNGLCCNLTRPCSRVAPDHVPPLQFLEVDRSIVKTGDKIGEGYFGVVYKGKLNKKTDVAIKCLKKDKMSTDKFLEEARTMQNLSHRKLVSLLAVCSESEPVLIIVEYMENGSLLHFLRKDVGSYRFPELVDMGAQIAEGMAYLEKKCYIHRDLRADNVLVDRNLNLKIADFGLARFINEDSDNYQADKDSKFPIKWTAPEAAEYRVFSTKSDVWSYGILLYEIISFGRTFYQGMNGAEILDDIRNGNRLRKPTGFNIECTDAYYDIMLTCWKIEPIERPTFEHLNEVFNNYFVATEPQYGQTQ